MLISINILDIVLDLIGKDLYSIGDETGRNVIIFGVNISSSPHIDYKNKDILILGKGPAQRLEHTLTAKKMYSINFNKKNTKFV